MRDFGRRLGFLAAIAVLGAAASARAAALRAEGRFFRDEQGAVVTLRGLNVAADAKVPPFRPIESPALLDVLPGLGVNVVRLVFTWEAFEPEHGNYDASYLDYYAGVVDELHARGIWVIVDVHQDAFSRFSTDGCGEGMPGWAISASVAPDVPDNGPNCVTWGIKFILDADTNRSWNDFYADLGGVRTRYLAMLATLAERLASHPAVIGYDMLNEPWGDEVTQIGPLYEDAARVLRAKDPDAMLFVSAQALTSAGQNTLLVRPSFDNFAYSPHYYDGGIVLAKVWPGGTLDEPVERMFAQANGWNVPLFVGEFGGPADALNVGAYVDAFYSALDARWTSATQWALAAKWDPVKKDGWNTEDFSIIDDAGELRANFRHRAHPVRVSGEPLRFSSVLDPEPVVEMSWVHQPDLGKTRMFAPLVELFGGSAMLVARGSVACVYENDRRHLSCESGEAGEKTVRLERCRVGAECLDSRPPADGGRGCSVSSVMRVHSKSAPLWFLLAWLLVLRRSGRLFPRHREPTASRGASSRLFRLRENRGRQTPTRNPACCGTIAKMRRRRIHLALVALPALFLPGCKEDSGPPTGGSAPPPVVEPASPASPPVSTATSPAPRAETTWLSVSRASVELGVIELRPGLRGVLTLASNDAAARELQKLWTKLDRPEGIAIDTHLPPESGKGRGPYGSRIFKPGEDGYAMAVEQKLESADYYLEKVPALLPSDTPPSIRQLAIARSGEPIGTLDFSTDPPTLSLKTTQSDGLFLKGHWEAITKQESIRVRFHQPNAGVDSLVTVESKPGEKTYPNAVRLYLILKHQYDEQRGYSLTIVP